MGDWDLDEWRAQEPKNCHSHLLSMLLGNTLMLPVAGGKLAIGAFCVVGAGCLILTLAAEGGINADADGRVGLQLNDIPDQQVGGSR